MRIHRIKPTLDADIAAQFVCVVLSCSPVLAQQIDPLPSSVEGPTKSAIIQFVDDVTKEGGPKYVRPEAHIATKDSPCEY